MRGFKVQTKAAAAANSGDSCGGGEHRRQRRGAIRVRNWDEESRETEAETRGRRLERERGN